MRKEKKKEKEKLIVRRGLMNSAGLIGLHYLRSGLLAE